MSELEFGIRTAGLDGDAFVVSVNGEADAYNAPELEEALQGVLALGGTTVAVDMIEVTFIDSTVLSVLLRYQGRFKTRGGDCVIVTDDRRVLRTFELTGLDKTFVIERRLADAIAGILQAEPASDGR
jgi:anti-sigma B factor antagonist